MEPFASVAQYEVRYGDVDDQDALGEILMDATREIASELERGGIDYADPNESFADRLMQACRSMAYRAMGAGESSLPFGATQYSQGAIGMTESYALGNPYGEVYISKAERKLLGLGRQKAACVWPYGGGIDAAG